MTVIKNQKSNTYEVRTYYKDWTGVRKQKTKRGFKRKCDAQEWERAFKLKENLSLDMYFEDFVDLYLNDIKSRIKYNTWLTKKHIVEKKILPYFSKKKLQEIKPSDIRQWQNTMMNYRNKQGEGYSQVYLKTIHNQLSAILNHAVNFYDLKSNAARKAGSMGKERTKEMLFWTKEEYMKFIEAVADKPISFYAFEILYWCGVRMGELLALTPADFDFQACTIRINKSYQRLEGKDIITDPKTVKSNRMITMPEFLSEIRVICHVKSSLAPEGDAIAFRLDKEKGFHWIGKYDISADDLLSGDGRGQKIRSAKDFLKEILANGSMEQAKIAEEAEERGIKKKTLWNAKKELQIDSVKIGNKWFWMLQEE